MSDNPLQQPGGASGGTADEHGDATDQTRRFGPPVTPPPGRPTYPGQQHHPQPPAYPRQPGQHHQAQPPAYPQQPGQHYHAPLPQAGYFDGQGLTGLPRHEEVTRGPNLSRLALIGTLALLFAVGGFALWRALANPGGAETPEEAASMLFESIDNEDLLGLAEIMLPSERESLLEPTTDMLVQLSRLELLSEEAVDGDGNVQDFSGLEFDIPAAGEPGSPVFEVTPVGARQDLQWVVVTDGTMEVTYDPKQLRDGLGGRLAEWIDAELDEQDLQVQSETVDLREAFDDGEPMEFAVVEENGSYYVSMYYTIAGFASGKVAPNFAAAPAPVGADSPEQAAELLLQNLVNLDAEGVLTMLDPEEFRAAYDYWDAYSPEMVGSLDAALREASAAGVTWDLLSVDARSEDRNGRKLTMIDQVVLGITSTDPEAQLDLVITVNATGLVATGTAFDNPLDLTISQEYIRGSGTIDGESFAVDFNLLTYEGYYRIGGDEIVISRGGDCLILEFGADVQEICDDQIGIQGSDAFLDLQQDYRDAFADAGTPGLTVVERDGRWFVSGFPTIAYTFVDILAALDREEFDRIVGGYEDLIESNFGLGDF
jgi:hypothetical protein